jgi:hypothetical protein
MPMMFLSLDPFVRNYCWNWYYPDALAGDPPNVLLCPRLGEFSWLDFHRANEAIPTRYHPTQPALSIYLRKITEKLKDFAGEFEG